MPPSRTSLVGAHPDVEPLLDAPAASQRARLLEAITRVVAEKGYPAATVADVVRVARVSRGTFYALFGSKEDCFLEAYRHGVDVMVERVRAAVRAEPGDWRAKLAAALRTYLGTLAAEPLFARTYLVEIHAAGPRAQAARDDALRRFAARYRASYEAALRERPELRLPSGDALLVLAGGVEQLVSAHVRTGALDRLPSLEGELFACALALVEGWGATSTTTPTTEGGSEWT